MVNACCNVVLLTLAVAVVVIPGAALQTRQSRKSATSCQMEPDLEFYLDTVSWKLYEDNQFGSEVGPLSLPKVHGQSADQGNLNNAATARVMRFVQAVKSSSLNLTAGNRRKLVVAGARNHTKSKTDEATKSAYCCNQIPGDDPYWQETERWDKTHPGYIKCQYSDDCTRKVTNSMRVESIRRALKGSQALFQSLNVPSLLYGSSAIGQSRCGDVIPWDVDCDFMLSEGSIEVIHEKVFGTKADWSTWNKGETSMDLASFGAPGLRLIKKTPCTPFEVVDTKEGFFCDVFTSTWYSGALYTPWWTGLNSCPTFRGCDKTSGGQRCYKYDATIVAPAQSCMMSGVVQNCAFDMHGYLQETYGHGYQTPNKTIYTGDPAAIIGNNGFVSRVPSS